MAVEIKNRLREVLKDKGMSQTELAEKVEVGKSTINNIISGKSYPSFELAMDIAFYLQEPIEKIFLNVNHESYIAYRELVDNFYIMNKWYQSDLIDKDYYDSMGKNMISKYAKKYGLETLKKFRKKDKGESVISIKDFESSL